MQTDCHFHKKSRQIIWSFFGKHLGTVWKKMTNFPNFKIFMGQNETFLWKEALKFVKKK